ncbi:MAG: peptidase C39, bacteriocin processing, partial [Betaproteobacteria bacterium]|nr:peptidase C39, bacteriocin processing [Betaproteobacteria bacterium]
MESRDDAPGIADAESDAPRVGGITNSGLSKRNTFYWDAEAYRHKGDYTKAAVLHWREEGGMAVGVASSTKSPLESRVWYAYDPKIQTTGAHAFPASVARVLPDGETQLARHGWNALGNRTLSVDPAGRETKIDYAPNGVDPSAARQKSAQGWEALAQLTWDGRHRPLTVKDAAGQTTEFTWNESGQLTGRTNALGATTAYSYNESGQLIKVTNPSGRVGRAYTYDKWGNVATETDSEGYTVKREHDAFDRPTRTTYPDGSSVEYTWDKLDLVMVKSRDGKVTRYRYDAARNLVEIQDPLRVTRFGYDAANRLVSLTDGGGQETRWQRDLQGRVIAKHTADGIKTQYEYDSAGRQSKRTDGQGQEQHLAYGKDGRLARISYKNPRVPTPEVSLTWDAHYPRIAAMRDATGETRYRYAPVGRAGALRLSSVEGGSGTDPLKLRYGSTGRIEGWSLGAAGEEYAFDALGRVTSNKNSHLGQFGYGYLGDTGQLVSSILAGTPAGHHYGYEPNAGDRRLKEIRHPQAARSFTYTNAPNSIITAMTETSQGQGVTWDFTYDGIDRLQTAKRADGQHYQYSFDKGDNLLSMAGPGGIREFNPSLGNKLNQAHYQHDPVGNRIADDRHRYTWDAENRLIKIAYKNDPQRQTEFRYDGQSRRVAIIETDGAKRVETKYTWCGNAICQARDAQGRPVAYYFSQGVYRPQAKG